MSTAEYPAFPTLVAAIEDAAKADPTLGYRFVADDGVPGYAGSGASEASFSYTALELAPRHRWRARVVPRPPDSYAGCTQSSRKQDARGTDEPRRCGPLPAARVESAAAPSFALAGLSIEPTAEVVRTSTLVATGAASRVAPNILSVAHWDRLLGGELYAGALTYALVAWRRRRRAT
jgi:hypothetical protein